MSFFLWLVAFVFCRLVAVENLPHMRKLHYGLRCLCNSVVKMVCSRYLIYKDIVCFVVLRWRCCCASDCIASVCGWGSFRLFCILLKVHLLLSLVVGENSLFIYRYTLYAIVEASVAAVCQLKGKPFLIIYRCVPLSSESLSVS